MAVKFHWLKGGVRGGLLHWPLSVELIIHMVGGREWKPPTAKKKKKSRRGHRRGGYGMAVWTSSRACAASLQPCLLRT